MYAAERHAAAIAESLRKEAEKLEAERKRRRDDEARALDIVFSKIYESAQQKDLATFFVQFTSRPWINEDDVQQTIPNEEEWKDFRDAEVSRCIVVVLHKYKEVGVWHKWEYLKGLLAEKATAEKYTVDYVAVDRELGWMEWLGLAEPPPPMFRMRWSCASKLKGKE